MGGIRETGAEFRNVLPPQGGIHKEFDVIGDETDISHLKIKVYTAAGIGDHQFVTAQQPQHPEGEADLLKAVALVGMEPTLHYRNGLALQCAAYKLALVSWCGGNGKSGDIPVGDHNGVFRQLCHISQTGAKNHGDFRDEAVKTRLHRFCGNFIIIKRISQENHPF